MTVADITRTAEWAALKRHRQALAKTRIGDLFKEDAQRFQHFSLRLDEFAFDYSKNLATPRPCACCTSWRARPTSPAGAIACSPASTSTAPKTARSITSPCGMWAASR